MKRLFKCFAGIGLLIMILSFVMADHHINNNVGGNVKDFTLRNSNNKIISLSNFKNAKGFMIVFTCNHCPFAKLYTQRLNELNKKYAPLGVPLLAINSMDTLLYKEESFVQMRQRAKSEKFNFQYLQDGDQAVGKNFGAKHTPQAFVIWNVKGEWVIKYSGAIDDDGENPQKANSYISNAVKDLLSQRAVSLPETESFGCKIFYRR